MSPRIASVLVLLLVLLVRPAPAAEQLPPAAEWVPNDALLVLDLAQPKPLLDWALDPKTVEAITALPAYRKVTDQPGFHNFRGGVALVEALLGTPWPTALRKLTGGGVLVSVHPGNAVLLIVDSDDEALLKKAHDLLIQIARSEAEKKGQTDTVVSRDYGGVTVWTLGKDEAHALIGRRLVLTNRAPLLKEVLDLRGKPEGSLARDANYQAAAKASAGAVGRAYANMSVLRHIPKLEKALSANDNPLAVLLLAGLKDSLRGADWLGLRLGLDTDGLVLEVAAQGQAAADAKTASTFALPGKTEDGAWPNLDVPRRIAAASLYRDLHAFYAAKDELFPDRTSGLIFFENMMGIFFSGRDLTDEVLAQARPEVRLVVAAQEYDPAIGTPRIQVPAFALVLRVKDARKFDPVMEAAWQKALGLVNFTRGQKAQPPLVLDRPSYGDLRYTLAAFPDPEKKDEGGPGTEYNFRPTLAMPGEFLILSSTDGLARDLIGALEKEKPAPVAGADTLVEVEGRQIAAALAANRENMVRQNMVEKAHSREQAEGEVDVILNLARLLGRAKLQLGRADGQFRATLHVQINRP